MDDDHRDSGAIGGLSDIIMNFVTLKMPVVF